MNVYKYPLDLKEYNDIEMPWGAKILSFQVQEGIPCIWALVDATHTKVNRRFRVAGTGHNIDDNIKEFIGTIQMPNGLVWHLFEIN